MKQFIFVVVFVTFASATNLPQNAEPTNLHPQPRIYEVKIKEMIQALIDKLGDPIKLNDVKLQIDKDDMKLDLAITGEIGGIKEYEIPILKLSLIGFKFNFKFVIPKLTANISSYDLQATMNILSLYGAGTIVTSCNELTLEGNGKLGSKGDGKLFLENIDVGISFTDFAINITGWEGDDERSKVISELLEDLLPEILQVYPLESRKILSDLIMKLAEGKTVSLT